MGIFVFLNGSMENGLEEYKIGSWEISEVVIVLGLRRYRMFGLKVFLVLVRSEKIEWFLRYFWRRINRN